MGERRVGASVHVGASGCVCSDRLWVDLPPPAGAAALPALGRGVSTQSQSSPASSFPPFGALPFPLCHLEIRLMLVSLNTF